MNSEYLPRSLHLAAVGDICPGDKTILGLGVCSLMKKHGVDFPFRHIDGLFDGSDIVLGNLEGLLSESIRNQKRPDTTFCGPSSFGQELKRIGFNVINVTNNHIFEHGSVAFVETVDILRKSGLEVCGLRDDTQYYSKPVFIKKDNLSVGIIGYNWIGKDKFPEADRFIAQSHDSIVNYTWHRNNARDKEFQNTPDKRNIHVMDDIRRLRKEVDIVILTAHWGYEFIHYPPYGVTLEARSFIDVGADMIIGSHPHVLQGTERYKGKWIIYSLGNFIFDMRFDRTKKTAVLNCEIEATGQMACKMVYFTLNSHFQPTKATAQEENDIARIVAESEAIIASENKDRLLDDDSLYHAFEVYYNKGKLRTILGHLLSLPRHPQVIRIIYRKLLGMGELILMRLRGQKTRW